MNESEAVFATFESALGPDVIERTVRQRSETSREVDGIVQRHFVHDRYGGVLYLRLRVRARRLLRPT